MIDFLLEIVILCFSAILIAPVFKKIGLGTSVAYIFSGSLVGPYVFNLIQNKEAIDLASELGVIFLLFVIGLSITPDKIRSLKKPILVIGPLQVFLTTAVLFIIIHLLLDIQWLENLIICLVLSLSSTAFGLAYLRTHKILKTDAANLPLGVLVFQDFLVVPLLFSVSYLSHDSGIKFSLFFIIIFFLLIIKYFIFFDKIIKYIIDEENPEIFTAICLLAVLGLAYVSKSAFGTTSIGAIIAGIALANSDYKSQLFDSVYPFKGLLLGLFFMSVGMSLDYLLLAENWTLILPAVSILVGSKVLINFVLFSKMTKDGFGFKNALLLGQSGEFGFIIFGLAIQTQLLPNKLCSIIFIIIALSMILSPILLTLHSYLLKKA